MELFYCKEKHKSLSLEPEDMLGASSSPRSCWRWVGVSCGGPVSRRGLAHPARGQAFWLQHFTTWSKGGAGCSSCWHPGVHGPWVLCGWRGQNAPGLVLRQQDSATAFSLLFGTWLDLHLRHCCCCRAVVRGLLLRNVDLFVWLLDRQTDGKLCLGVLRAHSKEYCKK